MNARVVYQHMEFIPVLFAIPRGEVIDAVRIAEIQSVRCNVVLAGANLSKFVLQRRFHLRHIAHAGRYDRRAPACEHLRGFKPERIRRRPGYDHAAARHIDRRRHRFTAAQVDQMFGEFGKGLRHVPMKVEVTFANTRDDLQTRYIGREILCRVDILSYISSRSTNIRSEGRMPSLPGMEFVTTAPLPSVWRQERYTESRRRKVLP